MDEAMVVEENKMLKDKLREILSTSNVKENENEIEKMKEENKLLIDELNVLKTEMEERNKQRIAWENEMKEKEDEIQRLKTGKKEEDEVKRLKKVIAALEKEGENRKNEIVKIIKESSDYEKTTLAKMKELEENILKANEGPLEKRERKKKLILSFFLSFFLSLALIVAEQKEFSQVIKMQQEMKVRKKERKKEE